MEQSTKTCELFDALNNRWVTLPELNYSTCAPGMIIVKDRYLYKLGGTTNIRKLEFLDLTTALANIADGVSSSTSLALNGAPSSQPEPV